MRDTRAHSLEIQSTTRTEHQSGTVDGKETMLSQTIFVKVEGTRKTLAIEMDPQRRLTALYAEL